MVFCLSGSCGSVTWSLTGLQSTGARRCGFVRLLWVAGCSTSAADSGTPRCNSRLWSGLRVRCLALTLRPGSSRRLGQRRRSHASRTSLRGTRRAGHQVQRDVRLRVLALRDDVLRQPGAGTAQRTRGNGTRRAALHRRLATEDRQPVAVRSRKGDQAVTGRAEETDEPRCGPGRSRWPTPTPPPVS